MNVLKAICMIPKRLLNAYPNYSPAFIKDQTSFIIILTKKYIIRPLIQC